MKLNDKLMAISILPLGIFSCLFFGAIIGSIQGTFTQEQITTTVEYSMVPLLIGAALLSVACFMPQSLPCRSN